MTTTTKAWPDCADGWRIGAEQQAAIAQAYATPERAYHSLEHVFEVLEHYRGVAAGPGWRQPREVYLAVCYHDAVYIAGRSDNEAKSAQLARAHIEEFLAGQGIDVERVVQLIELTALHGKLNVADLDAEAARFIDCDMAILGADAARFDRYDAAIALEYRDVVPAFVLRFKRRQFLRQLLAKPRIYLSDYGHSRWDQAARANLRRALSG